MPIPLGSSLAYLLIVFIAWRVWKIKLAFLQPGYGTVGVCLARLLLFILLSYPIALLATLDFRRSFEGLSVWQVGGIAETWFDCLDCDGRYIAFSVNDRTLDIIKQEYSVVDLKWGDGTSSLYNGAPWWLKNHCRKYDLTLVSNKPGSQLDMLLINQKNGRACYLYIDLR